MWNCFLYCKLQKRNSFQLEEMIYSKGINISGLIDNMSDWVESGNQVLVP